MREVYNGGKWTPARFRGFITSALRNASNRWAPKYQTRKAAHKSRGVYVCAGYKRKQHNVRKVSIDHIIPVIDVKKGFQGWDDFIENLFCEADNLQALCVDCHKRKTQDERSRRKEASGKARKGNG